MFPENRLKQIQDTVEESTTRTQYETRKAIANRLAKLVATAKDDDDLYARAWTDFPVWCAAFLDDDEGKPLFPARWQVEFADQLDVHSYVWALCSRKVGKTTCLAAKIAHLLCGPDRHRIIVFAPTHGQDFVFRKVRKYLRGSFYLNARFLANGGNDTGEIISTTTGSDLVNRSISISTGGMTIRGEYGDIVVVDEVQSIDQNIMDTVVFPIVADAYSKKHLWLIGTPNLVENPNLEMRWFDWREKASENLDYAYIQLDCYTAMEEGCVDPSWIRDQRKLMTDDDFAMEYLAKFPDTSARFFPTSLIEAGRSPRRFLDRPEPGRRYILSGDWAKEKNCTEMVVGELDYANGLLTYAGWMHIDPRRGKIPYDQQARVAKRLFWQFRCTDFIPDTTSNQDMLIPLLMQDEPELPGIPMPAFYGYDRDKEYADQRLGFKASDVSNWEMWRDHRDAMLNGRIKIPCQGPREEEFYEMFSHQHHILQAKPTRNGTMFRLESPAGENRDLAVACAQLSKYLGFLKVKPACAAIGVF
jgi:hypothetical protein